MSKSPLNSESVRPYRTDLEPNLFSLMRQARGFDYEGALGVGPGEGESEGEGAGEGREIGVGVGQSLFWPGCSLASYSQELVEAVSAFLQDRGLIDGISIACCGKILRYACGYAFYRDFTEQLAARLIEQGVRRIITGCPNCFLTFRRMLRHTPEQDAIELIDLSTVLADEGLRITPEASEATGISAEHGGASLCYCIHDSCPDKGLNVIGPAVRKLFSEVELCEMKHNQDHTRCCGIGKLQYITKPKESERLRAERIQEFRETGADQLVTCCCSCTNAFQDPSSGVAAVHYLELLFGIRIDWDAVYQSSEQALKSFS